MNAWLNINLPLFMDLFFGFPEDEVAAGIKASGVPRSEIFITGKLWNTYHQPDLVLEGLEDTLRELETDYIDLVSILMHLFLRPPPLISHLDLTESCTNLSAC